MHFFLPTQFPKQQPVLMLQSSQVMIFVLSKSTELWIFLYLSVYVDVKNDDIDIDGYES